MEPNRARLRAGAFPNFFFNNTTRLFVLQHLTWNNCRFIFAANSERSVEKSLQAWAMEGAIDTVFLRILAMGLRFHQI